MSSKQDRLQVVDEVLEQTFAYLQSVLPEEGVGLWSGTEGLVIRFTPLVNTAERPHVSYAVDPQQWITLLASVQAAGETPIALVHSHPTAEAVPSSRDLATWYYPDMWCVIVSFRADFPVWREYRI